MVKNIEVMFKVPNGTFVGVDNKKNFALGDVKEISLKGKKSILLTYSCESAIEKNIPKIKELLKYIKAEGNMASKEMSIESPLDSYSINFAEDTKITVYY
jgi:hypothetical protein